MRKIQLTVIMSLLCSLAFSQFNPFCFSNCKNPVYQTVIGQTSSSLSIYFEDSYGNRVHPQTASFKIRMGNKSNYKDLASANSNNPNNTVVLSNCGNGWYDATANTNGSAGGFTIVDIAICPPSNDEGTPIDKIDDKCDTNGYIIEIKSVTLNFASGNSSCSSNVDYCYCKLNRKSLINNNSILVSQNRSNNFLNIVIWEEILSKYQNIEIELYDITGKQLLSDKLYQPENQINIESLNKGFHLLIVRNKEEVLITKKVLINKATH